MNHIFNDGAQLQSLQDHWTSHHIFYDNYPNLFQPKHCIHIIRYSQTWPNLLYTIEWLYTQVQSTKSINHSMIKYSRERANALKERPEDPFIFTSIFVRKSLMLLLFLLRHTPVPKQGTKHLVTDALVLPCHLLVLPATIWFHPAARTTEQRSWPVSDPLPARKTTELAFCQASIQIAWDDDMPVVCHHYDSCNCKWCQSPSQHLTNQQA